MVKSFSIHYHELAIEELRRIHAFMLRRILDEVDAQLAWEPMKPSRSRKLLRPRGASAGEGAPIWQLRVGAYRVFYDVDPERRQIVVMSVRRKGRRTTEEIA
jgi:mRNA-degrading endonuclease RelE of RelBE toxin-antitoxin system